MLSVKFITYPTDLRLTDKLCSQERLDNWEHCRGAPARFSYLLVVRLRRMHPSFIRHPGESGVQERPAPCVLLWMPAFAGMTTEGTKCRRRSIRSSDKRTKSFWVMTEDPSDSYRIESRQSALVFF